MEKTLENHPVDTTKKIPTKRARQPEPIDKAEAELAETGGKEMGCRRFNDGREKGGGGTRKSFRNCKGTNRARETKDEI